jgi:hypothetical protein
MIACSKEEREIDTSYNPQILPANFSRSTEITNRYFPFEPGKTYVYEGPVEEGTGRSSTAPS